MQWKKTSVKINKEDILNAKFFMKVLRLEKKIRHGNRDKKE